MQYLFIFLVVLNAGYLGYQLLKEKEPAALQPITNITQSDFPVTLKLVSEHPILAQISNLSLRQSTS